MKRTLTLGIILVLLLASVGVVSANLVSNPGFELPVVSGIFVTCPGGTCPPGLIPSWTIGGNVNLIRSYWTHPLGSKQSIDMTGQITGQQARGTLSQQIPTTVNGPYKLTFDMSGNFYCGPDTKTLEVYWKGTQIPGSPFTFVKSGTWALSNMEWTQHLIELPNPAGTPTELRFVDKTTGVTNCGVALDNIVITPKDQSTPVPEFPTVALPAALIVGLIGAVLFMQKSKEE